MLEVGIVSMPYSFISKVCFRLLTSLVLKILILLFFILFLLWGFLYYFHNLNFISPITQIRAPTVKFRLTTGLSKCTETLMEKHLLQS